MRCVRLQRLWPLTCQEFTGSKAIVDLKGLFGWDDCVHAVDIGAAAIAEDPIYMSLLNAGCGRLSAFDGDSRQQSAMKESFRESTTIFDQFVFDGSEQTLYLADPVSGMTSLLKPDPVNLKFFNFFGRFSESEREEKVQTVSLDNIEGLDPIDLLKMDVQGAELTILKHGRQALERCVAIQLEVSWITLYEGQPSFGDIDVWMREHGYVPHCLLAVKRWSIAPTVFNSNPKAGGNQLLESDVVYIKNPMRLELLSDAQVKKLALIANNCLSSHDLTAHLLIELAKRHVIPEDGVGQFYESVSRQN